MLLRGCLVDSCRQSGKCNVTTSSNSQTKSQIPTIRILFFLPTTLKTLSLTKSFLHTTYFIYYDIVLSYLGRYYPSATDAAACHNIQYIISSSL